MYRWEPLRGNIFVYLDPAASRKGLVAGGFMANALEMHRDTRVALDLRHEKSLLYFGKG